VQAPHALIKSKNRGLTSTEIDMKRKLALVLAAMAVAGTGTVLNAQGKDKVIATVVKITGINWFNRMEVGVKEFGEKTTGYKTSQTGPGQADAAQQLRMVEDLLAKKVDAIAVVPNDPSSLETAFKKAMDRGVIVITHEAESQKNAHADIEAFDNASYGAQLNENLAACMGNEGKWTTFVAALGNESHVQWATGGANNAKAKHAKMVLVDALNESSNDANKAYEKAKEILRKHPDIKGFQGSSSLDVLGIGRAIDEAGLQDKTCVFGTGLPNDNAKFLESGAVDGISFWDPKDAGMAMNKLAQLLLEKKKITDGMNLGVKGYEKVKVTKGAGTGVVVKGQAWVNVGKSNYKQYPF
jgi:simple sugar transport system substrate-binding protein